MPSAHSSICSLGPAKLTNPSWEDRQTNMSLPPGLGGGTVAPVWEKNVLYPHTELFAQQNLRAGISTWRAGLWGEE